MSKSYGNAITLSEKRCDIRAKTQSDGHRPSAQAAQAILEIRDVCPVYDWHKLFSPPEPLNVGGGRLPHRGIGCIECKAAMADN